MNRTQAEKLTLDAYVKICKEFKISGAVRRNPLTTHLEFKFTRTTFPTKVVERLLRNGYILFSYNNLEDLLCNQF